MIGYFEGLDSERGIAWRTAESLALRGFLGLGLDEPTLEHSTISRTRRLLDLDTHRAVFTWILQVLATADLVKGTTIGIDATTLEANAALRSIVRRDSGETYQEFLTRLAQASGIETPTRADLARLDRTRPKKGRNTDWRHPHDPDARITKMKDGRTPLAHTAEHAVAVERELLPEDLQPRINDFTTAQYGSDAIAGVLNFLPKDNRSGGSLEFNTGTYRAGDGDAYTMAGNVGLPLGDTGFVNFSLEYGNADPTNRSVQRADAAALIAAGNTHVADPAQIWGNPTIEDELKLFGNVGHLFADQMQVYGHANYAEKTVTEGFYFRNPNNRANIYSLGRPSTRPPGWSSRPAPLRSPPTTSASTSTTAWPCRKRSRWTRTNVRCCSRKGSPRPAR